MKKGVPSPGRLFCFQPDGNHRSSGELTISKDQRVIRITKLTD